MVGDVAKALRTNGREVGGAFFVVNLVITCATLLLVGAREPWAATRWAWACRGPSTGG